MVLWFFIKLVIGCRELDFLAKIMPQWVSYVWREVLSLGDLKIQQHFRACQSDTFLIKLSHHIRAETIKVLDRNIDWYGQRPDPPGSIWAEVEAWWGEWGRKQAECYFGNTTLDIEGQIGKEARLRGLSAVGFHHGFLEKTEQQTVQKTVEPAIRTESRSWVGEGEGWEGRRWTQGPTGGKLMEPLCDLVVMDCVSGLITLPGSPGLAEDMDAVWPISGSQALLGWPPWL